MDLGVQCTASWGDPSLLFFLCRTNSHFSCRITAYNEPFICQPVSFLFSFFPFFGPSDSPPAPLLGSERLTRPNPNGRPPPPPFFSLSRTQLKEHFRSAWISEVSSVFQIELRNFPPLSPLLYPPGDRHKGTGWTPLITPPALSSFFLSFW